MAAAPTSSIQGETLEKAKRELNEDPETREQVIEELRRLIEEKETDPELDGIVFERKDGPFLLRFLRARKFDLERTLTLYIQYHIVRRDNPDIFAPDFRPQLVADILSDGAMNVLEGRMNDGSKMISVQPAKWDMERHPPERMIRTIVMVIEKLLEDEETQVHGISLLQYFKDAEFARVWRFAQTDAVQKGVFAKILQDSVPIRLKGIHLLCQPWYVSIVVTVVKPFLKEKIRQRLHIHGYDFEGLHRFVDPSCLPVDFQGTLPPIETFAAKQLFLDEIQDEMGVVDPPTMSRE